MKQLTLYEAADGKKFESASECEAYEAVGERNARSVFSEEEVIQMRREAATIHTAEIARNIGGSYNAVRSAIIGETWRHLPPAEKIAVWTPPIVTGENSPRSKLSNTDVRFIRDALARGVKGSDLGRRFDVTKGTISAIKCGRNWGGLE